MESDTDYQGIDGEDIPALSPLHTAIRCGMRIDDSLSRQGTYRGTETVGHQQEHPWALERIWVSVVWLMNSEPLILKKSKATP